MSLDGSISPFGDEGVWLRCSLHAHTTMSDGMLDPYMLRRYYAMGGFDVLAITDHDQLTPAPDREDDEAPIVLLPGVEISLRAPVSGGPLHVVVLGVRAMPQVTRGSTLAEAVAAVNAVGGVSIVAHPWWSGLLPDELGDLSGVLAVEVYNDGCEIEQGRGNSAQYWDMLLARGVRVAAIATDDHHQPGFNAFRGWTMVRAAERSADAVMAALRAGAFYSSSGPVIRDLRFEDCGLVVETSPATSIALVGQPPYGARVNAGPHGLSERGLARRRESGLPEGALDGELLTSVRFEPMPGLRNHYLRVEVTDERGRMAWANPVWRAEG